MSTGDFCVKRDDRSARLARCLYPLFATALACAGGADAAERKAPKHLLRDPQLVGDMFLERVGASAEVLEALFRDEVFSITVVDPADPSHTIEYEVGSFETVKAEETHRPIANQSCPNQRMSLARLDFAAVAKALQEAVTIADRNDYHGDPVALQFLALPLHGATFHKDCHHLAWLANLRSSSDPDDQVTIEWKLDGTGAVAKDGRMRPVALAKLLAAKPPKSAPAPEPQQVEQPAAREHDYLRDGIAAEVAQVERQIGTPLRLNGITLKSDVIILTIFESGKSKRMKNWRFHEDRKLTVEDVPDDGLPAWLSDECDPFSTADFAYDRLVGLINNAPAALPPMASARPVDVWIGRDRAHCRRPPTINIVLEDERGYGDVVYDARGNLLEAKVR